MIKIDLYKNEIVRTDVFQNDNMAEIIQIDFTNCDVNEWNKYLEIETAEGKSYRVDLGSGLITEYKITNMITRKGELKLNPLALKVDEATKKVVAQKGFKTFQINVQETVNAYGEGSQNYDDIVLPLIEDMNNLTNLVDSYIASIQLLEIESEKHKQFITDLFQNITRIDGLIVALDSRVTSNKSDIVSLNSRVNSNKADIDVIITDIDIVTKEINSELELIMDTLRAHEDFIVDNKESFDNYKLLNDAEIVKLKAKDSEQDANLNSLELLIAGMDAKITVLNTFMSEQKVTNADIEESLKSIRKDCQALVETHAIILQDQINTIKQNYTVVEERIEGIDIRLKYVEGNGGSGGGIPQELLDDVANLKTRMTDVELQLASRGNQLDQLETEHGYLSGLFNDYTIENNKIVQKHGEDIDKLTPRVTNVEETVEEHTTQLSNILDSIYPVGIILETTSNINPGVSIGIGTWERYGNGRVTVGLDSTQTEFDTVGKIGGANTHSLTADENGPHTHKYGTSTKGNLAGAGSDHGTAANTRDYDTSSSGTGKPHNNLQPYIVVYRWRRIK